MPGERRNRGEDVGAPWGVSEVMHGVHVLLGRGALVVEVGLEGVVAVA